MKYDKKFYSDLFSQIFMLQSDFLEETDLGDLEVSKEAFLMTLNNLLKDESQDTIDFILDNTTKVFENISVEDKNLEDNDYFFCKIIDNIVNKNNLDLAEDLYKYAFKNDYDFKCIDLEAGFLRLDYIENDLTDEEKNLFANIEKEIKSLDFPDNPYFKEENIIRDMSNILSRNLVKYDINILNKILFYMTKSLAEDKSYRLDYFKDTIDKLKDELLKLFYERLCIYINTNAGLNLKTYGYTEDFNNAEELIINAAKTSKYINKFLKENVLCLEESNIVCNMLSILLMSARRSISIDKNIKESFKLLELYHLNTSLYPNKAYGRDLIKIKDSDLKNYFESTSSIGTLIKIAKYAIDNKKSDILLKNYKSTILPANLYFKIVFEKDPTDIKEIILTLMINKDTTDFIYLFENNLNVIYNEKLIDFFEELVYTVDFYGESEILDSIHARRRYLADLKDYKTRDLIDNVALFINNFKEL